MSSKKINLTKFEQRVIKALTKGKDEHCKEIKFQSPHYSETQSDYEVHLNGFAGEMSFCKIYNIYYGLDDTEFSSYDVILSGSTIDVKTTIYEHGYLGVNETPRIHKEPPYWYALMTGSFPGPYRLVGFIKASELLTDEHYATSYNGKPFACPRYVAKQNELLQEVPL